MSRRFVAAIARLAVLAAVGLTFPVRAALAQELLASLDELSEEEVERLWADEVQRRLEQYRAGAGLSVQ